MKGKQFGLILVLLALLGGLALFLKQRNSAAWSETATTTSGRVLDFPLNDVSQLAIKEGATELNLVRKENVWTVKERADYPADFDKVRALLRKLWELRPVQDVKVGPSQLGRLQLTPPAAGPASSVLVALMGAGDKRLASLLIGKKYLQNPDQLASEGGGIPVGRYVMGQDGANHVFLISDTFDEIQTKPEQWLSHDFIKIENPKSIAVTGVTATMNWKLVRDAATSLWRLADPKSGEELDNAKAAGAASTFVYGSFADVLSADAPVAETGLDKPSTVRIETFDNIVYELRIGKLMGENYPVLVSIRGEPPKERPPVADEKSEDKARLDQEFQTKQKKLTDKLTKEEKLPARPFLIAKATVDQVLKDRAALLTEKTPRPSPSAATSPAGPKPASLLKPPVADTQPAPSSAKPPTSPGKRSK